MNEDDKIDFLKQFTQGDIEKKLDMWFYALEQEGLWEDMIQEMAKIAEEQNMEKVLKKMEKTKELH